MKAALLSTIVLGLLWPGLVPPAFAASKYTMPDLKQVDSTCFPNAAANLIYWFGENGYPQLLPDEKNEKARQEKLVTRLIIHCRTTFVQGTEFTSMVEGLSHYITSCGYDARLTYRGLGCKEQLEEGWFNENERDNKGFVLCVGHFRKIGDRDFEEVPNTGHAITLLHYTDHVAVVHDSAHARGQSGRRVVQLSPLGVVRLHFADGQVGSCNFVYLNGMPNLPKDVVIGLDGAVCIEMEPAKNPEIPKPMPKKVSDAQVTARPLTQDDWWKMFLSK